MYEKIDEPIRVLASFGDTRVRPVLFEWNNRKYHVDKVNLVHTTREGGDVVYYFSISDRVHYFKLKYNSSKMKWWLEEVFVK